MMLLSGVFFLYKPIKKASISFCRYILMASYFPEKKTYAFILFRNSKIRIDILMPTSHSTQLVSVEARDFNLLESRERLSAYKHQTLLAPASFPLPLCDLSSKIFYSFCPIFYAVQTSKIKIGIKIFL